ncbi:UPF0678 fatty acid-binding protein-like protein [Sesamum angolense]|uniref:UPF0678 fatty acid-binding protein-like protein n=1 Tax=Sesamum angolense TaxID=2727404 RepID=A0AAE1W509_9LAMI|nr:UPF0678 fatty acid-binding protein-like protein [Sesamum angolense]
MTYCGERGSNTRPSDLQSDALPTELSPPCCHLSLVLKSKTATLSPQSRRRSRGPEGSNERKTAGTKAWRWLKTPNRCSGCAPGGPALSYLLAHGGGRKAVSRPSPLSSTPRSFNFPTLPTSGEPMHSESGFWRPKLDGTIEVVIAQSTALVEVQKGTYDAEQRRVKLESALVGNATKVKEINRVYEVVNGELSYMVEMATNLTSLQSHLKAVLKKIR